MNRLFVPEGSDFLNYKHDVEIRISPTKELVEAVNHLQILLS